MLPDQSVSLQFMDRRTVPSSRLQMPPVSHVDLLFLLEDVHDGLEPGVHEHLFGLLALADDVPAEGVEVNRVPT